MKRLILFTLWAMNLVEQPAPEVEIDQGILSGKLSDDGSFYEYVGIPYATTNSSTRFQAPLPPPKWEGVYQAIHEHYHCPQNTPFGVVGMEDCLKINVYVPVCAQKPLPVMVYIHGGAFILGNGGKLLYGPDFIIKHDVIMVSFNYRLGPLGFLCLNIKEAPGNAGMKDQVAALRWVKKNIARFGGDPDNVTIFGHSAGGTSVALLVASDITEGLFQRAIVHSGSSLTHWATGRNPVLVATNLAKLLGRDMTDPKDLLNLFSTMPYKELISATAHIPVTKQSTEDVLHLPCIEKPFQGIEHFLLDLPYNLLKKPKNISLMYGSMDKEGLFFISEETDDSIAKYNHMNLLTDDLEFESKDEELKVDTEIRHYYFENKDINKKNLLNLSYYYTDLFFEIPMILEAELIGKNNESPIYYYYFTYSGGRNMLKKRSGFPNEPGACHGDDILYMFKAKVWPYRITKTDQDIIDWMTKTITNFAKYGDPTPKFMTNLPIKWLPNDKETLKFMYIGDELKMGAIPDPKAYEFWKNIYTKYRRI